MITWKVIVLEVTSTVDVCILTMECAVYLVYVHALELHDMQLLCLHCSFQQLLHVACRSCPLH